MMILKIKQKGLFVEIPGTSPTRTPAEIDISRCNMTVVDTYLRKLGIVDYEILSKHENKTKLKKTSIVKEPSKGKTRDERIKVLEKKVEQLVHKKTANTKSNSEQITDKLAILEKLTRKLLAKGPVVVEKHTSRVTGKINDEPVVEELEEKFIPEIDVSNMKMKKGSKKTIKRDNSGLDDSADLLSKIMGKKD